MRKAVLLLLFLSACGSKGGGEAGNAAQQEGADLLGNLAAPLPAQDLAHLQAMIDGAMPAALGDAKNAHYRNVRPGAGGSVCGEVAAKASTVFRPFVITPDALAVVGETPTIAFDDPADFLADAYVRWCATPEELQKLGPQLRTAGSKLPASTGKEVTADVLPPPDLIPPPGLPPPVPAPKPPAAKAAPPPPPQIDSFFNSVQHKGP